jgi:ribosomal protein L21E
VSGAATLVERGDEFERINDLLHKQWGWKNWKEGERVAVRIDPTTKASWGRRLFRGKAKG